MVQETSEERPTRAQRLLSLDVFRGVTILAMVLVNNAVDRKIQFAPLVHTKWHGWTLTDLIFPFHPAGHCLVHTGHVSKPLQDFLGLALG